MTDRAGARLTRVLALFATPAVVLVSVHELYLANQAELGRTVSVLFPFWAASLAAVAAGLVAQAADERPLARAALWAYYVSGFSFLVWGFLRALPPGGHFVRWILDTAPGAAGFGLGCLALLLAVARGASPRRVEPPLAAFSVGACALAIGLLAWRLEGPPPRRPPRDIVSEFGAGGARGLPNIYHLLLDSLQDELLEPCLPPGTPELLGGFVRFRMKAKVHSTEFILPSVFTGREERADLPGRLDEALGGPTSLLRDLRAAGYRTIGFVPTYLYAGSPSAFDVTLLHEEHAPSIETASLQAATFRQLVLYSVLPAAVAEPLAGRGYLGLDAETFGAAASRRAATWAGPVLSRATMEQLTALEPRLPDHGRYTFAHLMLPHGPHVLRSDCSNAGAVPSDLRQQTDCTLRLVTRFLQTLRSLGRLDGSIVLIHGDHGSGQVLIDGRLAPDEGARLRTALLVKPAGAHEPFRHAERLARSVDVTPTLAALARLPVRRSYDGVALDGATR